MHFALFNTEGLVFFFRWLHYFFGVTWIGLLYYFNFVQGPFFAETDAATKSNATQKLVPRALAWFRWGAMFTFLTGICILGIRSHQNMNIFETAWGISILTGASMGILMFLNVWLIIWPCQKVVIANATAVAKGGAPNPEAAAKAARSGVASRTNTLFSLPMLFFMGAASHLPLVVTATSLWPLVGVLAAIILLIELNAIKGKTGPMTSVKGVVHCGVALTVVLYLVVEFLTK